MKKALALILAAVMTFCICGCNDTPDAFSSMEVEYEYERVTVDENGNIITNSVPTTSSQDNITSTPSTQTTSSDTSKVTSGDKNIVIDYNTTVEVDICDDIIRGYLDAATPARQFDWLEEYSGVSHDTQSIELDWYSDASSAYTITFSENADFSNSHTIQVKHSNIQNSILVPGKTYYWKVTGTWSDEILGGGKIHIKDAPVRWIKANGTANMRDMGGWKTESGKTVRYEMMYRGQKLDNLTEEGIATFKSLGMKTELDLRYNSQKFQKEGTGMNYVFLETNTQYHRTLTNDKDLVSANYKKIFELLSDKSNYPFYVHCSAGADRTGTFAFITNGLLGVSYEDLTRDFELTSFSASGKRWRSDYVNDNDGEMTVEGNTVAWGKLYNEMMAIGQRNGCTTLSQSIEYWLTSVVGVPKAHIDSFKSIMLE